MKTIALSVALLFTAGVMSAQAPAPAKPADATTPAAPGATAKPTDPKAAKTPAKPAVKEKEPVIPGVNIARANGTWLGLEVVGGQFKLSFYDKKKKPMNVDVTRASARWPNTRSAVKAWNRTILNPSGTALLGQNPVLPPLVFNVHLVLLQGDGDDAKVVEEYDAAFRG